MTKEKPPTVSASPLSDGLYPKIGTISKIPKHITKGRGICKCGAKADFIVDIEWNYMRGDDSVKKACADHKNALEFLIGA